MIQESYAALMDGHMASRGFRRSEHDFVSAWVKGNGPAVVLLHGALSTGQTTFGWTAPRIARRARVVIPDLPGFGRSTGALRSDEVTVRSIADRLLDALPHWAGERYHVVGESLGGWIAMRMAVAAPAVVTGLTLVNAAGYWRDEDAATARHRGELIVPDDRSTLEELFTRVLAKKVRLPRLVARDLLKSYRAENPAWAHIIQNAEADALTAQELAALDMPVHVVWGARDALLPLAMGEALASAVPGARLTVLPKCAHVPPVEDARGFSGIVVGDLGGG